MSNTIIRDPYVYTEPNLVVGVDSSPQEITTGRFCDERNSNTDHGSYQTFTPYSSTSIDISGKLLNTKFEKCISEASRTTMAVFKHASDIEGNQYVLLKDTSSYPLISMRRDAIGSLRIFNQDGDEYTEEFLGLQLPLNDTVLDVQVFNFIVVIRTEHGIHVMDLRKSRDFIYHAVQTFFTSCFYKNELYILADIITYDKFVCYKVEDNTLSPVSSTTYVLSGIIQSGILSISRNYIRVDFLTSKVVSLLPPSTDPPPPIIFPPSNTKHTVAIAEFNINDIDHGWDGALVGEVTDSTMLGCSIGGNGNNHAHYYESFVDNNTPDISNFIYGIRYDFRLPSFMDNSECVSYADATWDDNIWRNGQEWIPCEESRIITCGSSTDEDYVFDDHTEIITKTK